jgi:hypothetical protein
MADWADAIDRMVRAEWVVKGYGRDGQPPFAPPRPPARPERLRAAIDRGAGALDAQYVQFLRHADGWPELLHSFGLFGTPELLGDEFDEAVELISYLDPEVLQDAGVAEEDLFPIGWSPVAIDVFVTVSSAPQPRPVIWFAGVEVERFDDVKAFFRYMTDSNIALADDLRDRADRHSRP